MTTPETRLAVAHAAIAQGELASAKAHLAALLNDERLGVDAEHALAVVERRLGNFKAARAHFEATLRARPNDPYVLNNFANCLRDADDPAAAIGLYRRALEFEPKYLDALVNLGLTLKNQDRLDEARATLQRAVEVAPTQQKAWHALGVVLRDLGELDDAATALDRALTLAPGNIQALHARARVEAERGGHALKFYALARNAAPDDPEITLGYAVAKFESGQSDAAIATLEQLTASRPDWVQGHTALAQIRWQLGDTGNFARSFDAALHELPGDVALHIACFGTLMRSGRYAAVLDRLDAAKRTLEAEDLLDRYEAVCASESGDFARAEQAFARQQAGEDRGLQVAHLRHLLRTRRPDEAAREAEGIVRMPGGMQAWPYLGIAWRLLEDPRADWLDGNGRLFVQFDCEEMLPKLQRLAAILRGIHHGRIHPFDQSLRGGTQTDGHLFGRSEPEIAALRACIGAGVARYIKQLPPPDPRHPFLQQPRSGFRFAGSYSVRLRRQGFHVSHMHPEAWISCCFYVDMPASIGNDASNPAGWLQIGRPPHELGLDLPATTLVKPVPGRLALFPSIMWHGTVPFEEGERLTVVSDLVAASVQDPD